MNYPGNKQFAFTILDDTDNATRLKVEPVYRYLQEAGFRTTKTVWPLDKEPEQKSLFTESSSLCDDEYLEFIQWLISKDFEVTWHGPAMETSSREKVQQGLEVFKEKLGFYPNLHVNHSRNEDNVYWGIDRFDNKIIKTIINLSGIYKNEAFSGQVNTSPYYWGNLFAKHFKYCRSFTFSNINSLSANPSMPYHDPKRPEVKYWFSTSDASSIRQFENLFTAKNMQQLINSGGMCILSTHLGKGFCPNGQVQDSFKRVIDYLANHDGWFVPVSEMLDWRLQSGFGNELSKSERTSMETRWLIQTLKEKTPYSFGT